MILNDGHLTQLQETGEAVVWTRRTDLGNIMDALRADCDPLGISPMVILRDIHHFPGYDIVSLKVLSV